MFDRVRSIVLRVLRVPHDPTPPFGAPGSVRVFRAGKNFYRLRLLRWALAQGGAALGLAVSVSFLHLVFSDARNVIEARQQAPANPAAATAPAAATPTPAASEPKPAGEPAPTAPRKRSRQRVHSPEEARQVAAKEIADRAPLWVIDTLEVLKLIGVAIFIVQLPFSYAAVRLEFEQHWYIVTDRSLRIRRGLASVLESTMSFANVQQVVVQQGPLQRLFGIADLRVQSAGGGGDTHEKKGQGESLHTGIFHGVENAEEIRDLILGRLRAFRQAGLGDPDDPHHAPATAAPGTTLPAPVVPASATSGPEAVAAARELLTEARALRAALA